jgi:hypothetical protein
VENEGAYSSRLGFDFQAVSYEQTDTLWSQQPTLQHQHEDPLSEQGRGLLQWSVGVSNPPSQRPLGMVRYMHIISFKHLPRTTNRPPYRHLR